MKDAHHCVWVVLLFSLSSPGQCTDCSLCPTGVHCNSTVGCEACEGTYRPDCTNVCNDGKFGTNCAMSCGHCFGTSICDKTTGSCPNGCQSWWTPEACLNNIVKREAGTRSCKYVNSTDTAIVIECQQVEAADNLVTYYGYHVKHKKEGESRYSNIIVSAIHVANSTTIEITVTKLTPNTVYEFTVYPFRTANGETELGDQYTDIVKAKTKCTNPDSPTLQVKRVPVIEHKEDKLDITFQDLQLLRSGCNSITRAWIYSRLVGTGTTKYFEQNLTTPYFAIMPEFGGDYDIWLIVQNDHGINASSKVSTIKEVLGPAPPDNSISLSIVLSAVGGCVLAIIIIAVIVVCCKRTNNNNTSSHRHHEEMSTTPYDQETSDEEEEEIELVNVEGQVIPQRPPKVKVVREAQGNNSRSHIYANFAQSPMTDIDVTEIEDYVIDRLTTDAFTVEYKSLPPADQSRCIVAKLPNNIQKNRFRNIYPYDENRVLLRNNDSMKSDFINASYITGHNRQREYIATQGPYNTTLLDFWYMVWQEGANRIIMVSNMVEMGKVRCTQYWPKKVNCPEEHGPFTMTTEIEEVCADYTTRVIVVKKKDQVMKVHHFHFTTWHDKNRPVYGETSLLSFYRKIHAFDMFAKGPMIVHCSAGVGRTGTFIALDILQYQAAKERIIDVYACVKRLRADRMIMVQTKLQYIFIHNCIVEFVKCGDTSYNCQEFETTYDKLCTSDPELDGVSRLELQFQLLHMMKEQPTGMKSRDGLNDENRNKNRDLKIIPDDFDRPHLVGKAKNDYINAVFVDSFRLHDFYLVTQMPLPHTVADFWRLVASAESKSIVMLNQFDNTDETCKPYWPTKEHPTQTYGQIEVTLVKSNTGNSVDSVFTRDFLVTSKFSKSTEGVLVRHFQLLTWPSNQDRPPNKNDILKLFDLMHTWNKEQGMKSCRKPGNTIVHCFTGGVQSGLLCGISHVLERMELEHEIDAFQAVRFITRRRPQFINTLGQYRYLYEIAMDVMKPPDT